jgi:hypothetical protein
MREALGHRYNLKWSKTTDSLQSFERFFSDDLNFDTMLQRIKEIVQELPTWAGNVVKFGCLVGLRSAEILEAIKLINDKEAFAKYYNPDR